MRKAKPKTITFPTLCALEGNTQAFLDRNEKPECVRCGNRKGLSRVLVFTKYGFEEDTITPVFKCPKCLENTCFTYTIEHQIGEFLE